MLTRLRSRPAVGFAALLCACGAGVFFAACGSSSTSAPAPPSSDAAVDAPADASHGGGEAGPLPDAGGRPDAQTKCDLLKGQVEQLTAPARACCPTCGTSECTATTNGICCPISVDTSSVQAVNNLDQAVKAYLNECDGGCTTVICQPAPSNVCDGTGMTGTCQ